MECPVIQTKRECFVVRRVEKFVHFDLVDLALVSLLVVRWSDVELAGVLGKDQLEENEFVLVVELWRDSTVVCPKYSDVHTTTKLHLNLVLILLVYKCIPVLLDALSHLSGPRFEVSLGGPRLGQVSHVGVVLTIS